MLSKKHRAQEARFDLTPMIDVTFQLLIFFIIATRFKIDETSRSADLPEKEGPPHGEPQFDETISIALQWRADVMTYEVQAKHAAINKGRSQAIFAGSIETLLDPTATRYREVFAHLHNALEQATIASPKARKVEIAMALDPSISSRAQINDTAPWGFVTLAIDVLTKINLDREEPLAVAFKNTSP